MRSRSLLGLLVLVWATHAAAVDPPHDASNNIDCLSCHVYVVGQGFPLPRGAEQEAMCRSCHNPTGQASGMSDVANHIVDGGALTVDCGSCHDPHMINVPTDPHPGGATAPNLSAVRQDTTKYLPAALEPALFQVRPDHFSFAEDDPPWNGICQTCHTATNHHTQDGSADHDHNVGMDCTTCHAHTSGFLASGGCVDCHAIPQGPRRQIVDSGGDFDLTSHHVAGAPPEDGDCVACHYVGAHGSGTVKLADPDDGNTTVYDYDPADPAGIEPFCLGCHDADGALDLPVPDQPFSDGQTPTDIDQGGSWSAAAHRQFGYAPNNNNPVSCLGDGSTTGCHANAHGSDNERLLGGAAVASQDQFCFRCHTDGMILNDALSNNRPGGYVSADDIEEAFGKSERHDLGTSFERNSDTFEIQCSSCHNPHVVTGKYWDAEIGLSPITRPDFGDPVGNPYAMGTTLWGAAAGEKMDDFAAQGAGTGGWYYSTARGGSISWDQGGYYQPPKAGNGYDLEFDGDVLPDYTSLCLDCHTARMSAANPEVNWGQGIACTDNSVDPPDQRIECGAQHGLGAANKPNYVSDDGTAGFWGNSGNPDVLFAMNYVTRGRHNGHFMRWPYDSAERAAGINFVMSCTDCHEAHGSDRGGIVRERFNVNANGDCGTGGDASPNGENCSDGGNWNSYCNACHYYYGGQHAGMSCGNASCHEANSPHRIIHVTHSGGTQLTLTAAGYEDDYIPPDFTPDVDTVEGDIGSTELLVTFKLGAYGDSGLTANIDADDLWFLDQSGNNPRTIVGVSHTAGENTAGVTMSAPLVEADLYDDILTSSRASIWAWYDGGYENWATGILDPQAVSAGPWPVTITPSFTIVSVEGAIGHDGVVVTFNQGAYANVNGTGDLDSTDFVLTDSDDGRTIIGVEHYAGQRNAILWLSSALDATDDVDLDTVAVASGSAYSADGYAAPSMAFYIEGTGCPVAGTTFQFAEPAAAAISWDDYGMMEGTVGNPSISLPGDDTFFGDEFEVDQTYVQFIDDLTCLSEPRTFTIETLVKPSVVNLDYGDPTRDTTSQTLYMRKASWLLRIMRADFAGDGTDPTDSARLIMKYKPLDNHGEANMKQVSTSKEDWPITLLHWYRIRLVFNADKLDYMPWSTGVVADIFVDDLGTDGLDTDEQWPGFVNASHADPYDSGGDLYSCWPYDTIMPSDNGLTAGVSSNLTGYPYNGNIDWITYKPIADYTGVDDPPN